MAYPALNGRSKARRRYGVYYYRVIGDFAKQDSSGSTDDLAKAYGHAASHVAKGELLEDEYSQALVIDRHKNKIVRTYRRAAGGSITVKNL